VALGTGHLFKAIVFPVAILLLGALLAVQLLKRRPLQIVALTAITFALVSAPQVASQSRLAGSLTFGQVGKLNYGWDASDLPKVLGTTDAGDDSAERLAPESVPRLSTRPSVYHFSEPRSATFPLDYDGTR
jgi:hypothetical protein